MRRSHLIGLLASASALALAAPAFAADAPPAQANTVQEVIVTAQKKPEAVKDVPMSITALPGDQLQLLDAHSFQDYAKLVPGLSLENTSPGETRITLRGLNAGGVASTVAAYIDETPMGSSSGLVDASIFTTDIDTYDMNRVEVLRGPQGTLYGANTEGGLIKFVTNAPLLNSFSGALDASVTNVDHGGTAGSIAGVVNLPVGDTAALRVTGYDTQTPGWVDDPLLGEKDVNRGTRDGFRGSFLWKPSDVFSLRLSALGQDIDIRGGPGVDVETFTLQPSIGAFEQDRFHDEPRSFKYRNYNATATWDMGWATLVSSTSYGTVFINSTTDVSALLFPGVVEFQTTDDTKFTQELRLTSQKSDRLEWQAGLYSTNEQGGINQNIAEFSIPSQTTVANGLEIATVDSKYTENSAFGTLTYHFTPQFDVEVGGRYGQISQNGAESLGGLLLGPTISHSTSEFEHVATYSAAARWHVTDTTMVYARIASGFRPGGPNVTPVAAPPGTPLTYNPDTTVSYEAGVKSTLLDGSLVVDAALFRTDWKGIQVLEVINNTGVNGNAGDATSQGFEWSTTWIPLHGLTLMFSGAYTDASLTSQPPPAAAAQLHANDGDELPFVPKWSGALDAEYRWPLANDLNAFVGGTWAYIGDRKSDFGDPDRLTLGSYDTVDLRAGVEVDRWRVELFAKNVGNSEGLTSLSGVGATLSGGRSATFIQPRTIGVELSAKF